MKIKKEKKVEKMIEIVKPIYRDEKASELNNLTEKLLHNLESENEALIDTIMDMTLNHNERKEKSFWETVSNPENYQELITLQSRSNALEYVISEIKSIIYSDYISGEVSKTPEPRMTKEECQMWLGTKVKPLILKGTTKQQDVSEKLSVGASTISTRVKSGFSKGWKDYVELVIQGIY